MGHIHVSGYPRTDAEISVQNETDKGFSLSRRFAPHATVGIEELRCNGDADETADSNRVADEGASVGAD